MEVSSYYLEDNNFYFVRKPAGIATSFGEQHSFLDEIIVQKPMFFLALQEQFGREEEYGLLNRLDNDTQGFVYFAKSPAIKEQYEYWQNEKILVKQYMCDVKGRVDIKKTAEKIPHTYITDSLPEIDIVDLFAQLQQKYPDFDITRNKVSIPGTDDKQDEGNNSNGLGNIVVSSISKKNNGASVAENILLIQIPIMHSTSSADRMIAVLTSTDRDHGRGKEHFVKTFLQPLQYDEKTNTTRCLIYIQQGIRHQIRVHLAKIGYPIVGDVLYGGMKNENADTSFLHLWSTGFGYPSSCNSLYVE